MQKKYIIITTTLLIATTFYLMIKSKKDNTLFKEKSLIITKTPPSQPELPVYTAQKFNLAGKLQGLSHNQIEEHKKLYEGYVTKRNEIAKKLTTVNRNNANNHTFSEFRGLKLDEIFTANADILHRLYFENMGNEGKSSVMGTQMQKLILESFGSMTNFFEDLMDTAKSARGWVLTGYSLDDHKIHNFMVEAHNLNIPVFVMPLLILDVYEHAYFMDFGTQRARYLDVFKKNINWPVVEERIAKYVLPFVNE